MTLRLQFKGFDYVSYYNGGYENADSLPSLVAVDANAAALASEYAIDADNNTVVSDPNYTDSLTAIGDTISEAEGDGLSVMVRPLLDFLNSSTNGSYSQGEFRSYYNPGAAGSAGANAFFASYQTMLVAEARVAEADGAQMFCIGTELDQLTGPSYLSYWDSIITAVKAVYTGALTYSADWDDDLSPWQDSIAGTGLPAGTGDITTQISFWSQLNYVGIDEYAPISDAANPTLTDLIDGWEDTPTDPTTDAATGGESLIAYYESVAATIGKPLLFTELGYENATDAASQPAYTSTYVEDDALQANLYTAFFDAWRADGNASLAGVYFWNWDPNASEVGAGNVQFSPQALPAQTVVETNFAACYAAGTRLATPHGETAVEALRVGDLVLTASGQARRVIWLGHRRVDCAKHPSPRDVWPIRISPHAFADGQPRRTLYLSPDHAVFVDGVLIPIRHLTNGATIVQEPRGSVTYWHVELARHDVLLAEGLPAESYLDTGNRGFFANGGKVVQAHPDFAHAIWHDDACAPLVLDGAGLQAARSLGLARAEALGHAATGDPGLHVLDRGRVLHPTIHGRRYRFHLPAGAAAIRLVSRSAVPAEIRDADPDHRRLGVAVARLALDGTELPLTDARLGRGWHDPEPAWRWTDGDAVIAKPDGKTLDIEIAMTLRYWAEKARAA